MQNKFCTCAMNIPIYTNSNIETHLSMKMITAVRYKKDYPGKGQLNFINRTRDYRTYIPKMFKIQNTRNIIMGC